MKKRNGDKIYWSTTFAAWPVEDGDNLFLMTLNEYPLIITFSHEDYLIFKKDIFLSVADDSVDDEDLVIQDQQSIKVYNGVNDDEKYMFVFIKNKDLTFGLPYDAFKQFKKDIVNFSAMDLIKN